MTTAPHPVVRKDISGKYALTPQIAAGADPTAGYLHIGKTGGTGIRDAIEALRAAGHRPPLYLPHGWDLARIVANPQITLHLVLRDPLERTVSGFNSRLRQGRPDYDVPWTTDEALAFTWFDTPQALLQAMLSDREIDQSRVAFTFRAISHLRRGYGYYFGGLAKLKTLKARIGIVEPLARTDRFLDRLGAACGAPPEFLRTHYSPRHRGTQKTTGVLAAFTDSDRAALRACLAREYNIYTWLTARAGA